MKKKETARIKSRRPAVLAHAESVRTDYQSGDLNPKRTTGGLGYVIHERGDGRQLLRGERVQVLYVGLLSATGEVFDDNFASGKPFRFHLGNGEVIDGWDVGIALMRRGDRATLFIPPALGYGKDGYPPEIPGDSELVFYVELV
ncbi:FKBP-type peptidyl-prolyl cis-trans isomerase [Neolewinella antarctica]|uniref:Peptidyl-prolyl cis-trans isomerase n=1 Tax=Neolewinella antarctica TaxID=442734 RepID=A0ABX0X9H3_9BACT|nr:FKBP-type peptidyl-prolyl cis-trans isomerase [Neolewinella antarctica]NJC25913.1 FKBP-type peptidyl-prolyl cis-trans isomerase [Neolewinella antarctica]